jgi:Family of unknown function (DUF6167)
VTRRLFYVALGATVGVLVVRRLSQAAQRLTPAGVQGSVSGALGGLTEAVREFTAEVKGAMAEREVELRDALGLDGTNDDIDAHTFGG